MKPFNDAGLVLISIKDWKQVPHAPIHSRSLVGLLASLGHSNRTALSTSAHTFLTNYDTKINHPAFCALEGPINCHSLLVSCLSDDGRGPLLRGGVVLVQCSTRSTLKSIVTILSPVVGSGACAAILYPRLGPQRTRHEGAALKRGWAALHCTILASDDFGAIVDPGFYLIRLGRLRHLACPTHRLFCSFSTPFTG